MIDGTTTDLVTIGELATGVILWYIDNQTNLVLTDKIHHIIFAGFIGPCYSYSLYTVIVKELSGSSGGVDGVTLLGQLLCWLLGIE